MKKSKGHTINGSKFIGNSFFRLEIFFFLEELKHFETFCSQFKPRCFLNKIYQTSNFWTGELLSLVNRSMSQSYKTFRRLKVLWDWAHVSGKHIIPLCALWCSGARANDIQIIGGVRILCCCLLGIAVVKNVLKISYSSTLKSEINLNDMNEKDWQNWKYFFHLQEKIFNILTVKCDLLNDILLRNECR